MTVWMGTLARDIIEPGGGPGWDCPFPSYGWAYIKLAFAGLACTRRARFLPTFSPRESAKPWVKECVFDSSSPAWGSVVYQLTVFVVVV